MDRLLRVCSIFALLVALGSFASAYSVLTHEEVIDLAWDQHIKPLLVRRFPNATPEDLKKAHAYAYGGAVIQDLGYYPFGNHEFSDLVHYARSGEFVHHLLEESKDLNEYAFALGALAHYASDITGHPAVNQAVAVEFPKLRAKFGNSVTYVQAKSAHLETEFGFDVSQVAKGRYAPESYHNFIGFEVAKPVLERAFKDTYGIELTDVIKHEDLALGTYRRSISGVIPEMTKVAVASRETEMRREIPNYDRKKFLYRLSRSDYERDWGKNYERPGFGARILAVILKIMPKVGPFRGLAYKNPTPKTQDIYFKSVNATFEAYTAYTKQLRQQSLSLREMDLDTGAETRVGGYSLCDDTYAKWAERLAKQQPDAQDPKVRHNVLAFFSGGEAKLSKKDRRKRTAALQSNLKKLQTLEASSGSIPAGK